MYYYVFDGETYEEYHKTVFMSEIKYSREEFLEIIKKAFKIRCESICDEYEIVERCDILIGTYELWSDEFNETVESISDLEVIKADEWIHVGLGTTPNRIKWEILNTLQSLRIPDCKNKCKSDRINKKYRCVYNGGLNDG